MCVCMSIYKRILAHMCLHVCGFQKLTLDIFLSNFQPYFLSQDLSWSSWIQQGISGQQIPGILLSLTPYS